jgi:hypothetical protein
VGDKGDGAKRLRQAMKKPDATPVTAEFVIDANHRLFQIEKSFRMSKHDLQARPIYHRRCDSIEAHLTIVFAALPSAGRSRTKRMVDQEPRRAGRFPATLGHLRCRTTGEAGATPRPRI